MSAGSDDLKRVSRASQFFAIDVPEQPERSLGPSIRLDFDISGLSDSELMQRLRQFRAEQMRRIVFQALGMRVALDETLAQLSSLAEVCCVAACEHAYAQLLVAHGQPKSSDGSNARPVILAMGKLGGRELNFSSDIDLIFLHTADGMTDGESALDNQRFFIKLAQAVGRLLSERTPDGFVFRVDTMLRPFGSAGPVSISTDAAEDYYENHGREWERYAMIKARPIAGDIDAGYAFLGRIQPFIYRRYLDYNAIGSLRELKQRIHDDVVARKVMDDVKLGPGGIRELEFIVQSFQLVRGGLDQKLRNASLRPTLAYLGQCELLPIETAQKLDECYVFLRELENAIQMYDDQQTHRLPRGEAAREALCIGLNIETWEELLARYESVTRYVNQEFQRVFAEPEDAAAEGACAGAVNLAFALKPDRETVMAALADYGFESGHDLMAQHLIDLAKSHLVQGLSEPSLLHLRHMLGLLLNECLEADAPVQTAERVLRVIDAISGRSTYLTLLDESPVVRSHLIRLCGASVWVTEQIAASPAVLDALLDPRSLYSPPGREEMFEELSKLLEQVPSEDVETGMDVLRRYRNEITVRIAAAEIAGSLKVVQVSDHLTWLAEACLSHAMRRARAEVEAGTGEVYCEDGTVAELAAIGYGKFGGIELGYGSDLDLVFIYDNISDDADSQRGARNLPAPAWFTRVVQRIVHRLSTLTPAGRAYEIDLELRPNGQSGAVAVSFDAYARYQREKAWTWEHQALTRARFVAGPERLRQKFDALREEIICRKRDADELSTKIVEMREKMRRHSEKRRTDMWDVKQGRGGIIDCEFITQFLVLRDAAAHPELVRWSDNWRQLDALMDVGSLSLEDKEGLIAHYRSFRVFANACALQRADLIAPATQFESERAAVVSAWDRLFPHAKDALSATR